MRPFLENTTLLQLILTGSIIKYSYERGYNPYFTGKRTATVPRRESLGGHSTDMSIAVWLQSSHF